MIRQLDSSCPLNVWVDCSPTENNKQSNRDQIVTKRELDTVKFVLKTCAVLRNHGFEVHAYDNVMNAHVDGSDPHHVKRCRCNIRACKVLGLVCAIDCHSWTLLRQHTYALRTSEELRIDECTRYCQACVIWHDSVCSLCCASRCVHHVANMLMLQICVSAHFGRRWRSLCSEIRFECDRIPSHPSLRQQTISEILGIPHQHLVRPRRVFGGAFILNFGVVAARRTQFPSAKVAHCHTPPVLSLERCLAGPICNVTTSTQLAKHLVERSINCHAVCVQAPHVIYAIGPPYRFQFMCGCTSASTEISHALVSKSSTSLLSAQALFLTLAYLRQVMVQHFNAYHMSCRPLHLQILQLLRNSIQVLAATSSSSLGLAASSMLLSPFLEVVSSFWAPCFPYVLGISCLSCSFSWNRSLEKGGPKQTLIFSILGAF